MRTSVRITTNLAAGAAFYGAFCVSANAQSIPAAAQVAALWWIPLGAALIGAASALATTWLKESVFQKHTEVRSKQQQQKEIFRNYASPLITASENLIWRFSEIFVDHRHHFLKSTTLPLVYNEYKRVSTLYRIASLLGWIRAVNLELNALPRGSVGGTPDFNLVLGAIGKVQSALADGPFVELDRLKKVCSIWRLPINFDDKASEDRTKKLATNFEVKLYALAGDSLKHDSSYIANLGEQEKLRICAGLYDYICKELKYQPKPENILIETLDKSIAALSYREALIYRDWQDAIGDSMLAEDPNSVRRYKIIGYEKFEEILAGSSLWMKTFRESIVDIDFEFTDPNDSRAKQLKDLASGVSAIIIALYRTEDKDLVSTAAVELAKKIVPPEKK